MLCVSATRKRTIERLKMNGDFKEKGREGGSVPRCHDLIPSTLEKERKGSTLGIHFCSVA